jgi:gas vesicle protein
MNDRIYYSRDAELRANRDRTMAVGVFLVFGLGIGAILALLLAPKSGEQVRHEISHAFAGELAEGREESAKAVRRLEKDISDLRKNVEDRLKDLR